MEKSIGQWILFLQFQYVRAGLWGPVDRHGDREAPLWDGTAEDIQLICGFGKSEYFCKGGLDRFLPDGQISRARPMGSELLTCCGVVAGASREARANR
jgi:hypothetical protein